MLGRLAGKAMGRELSGSHLQSGCLVCTGHPEVEELELAALLPELSSSRSGWKVLLVRHGQLLLLVHLQQLLPVLLKQGQELQPGPHLQELLS